MTTPVVKPAPSDPGAPLKRSVLFLLPFVVFVLHTLEELPGFAAWATRHFGPETTNEFVAYHIPLMLLVLLCSWRAMVAERHGGWVVMAIAFQWQFCVNAVFHLSTWVAFGEYAPGVVIASVVALPSSVYFFSWVRREDRATMKEVFLGGVIGTVVAALAIGFLFL
ncbi:HXXEE domain-containing protein [Nonomuraea sp. NPDC049480]|uniref:HXXEE domain-containing protein n=1 Tax=Nonomuraea sp. NPDC049480 TaxID=3364353 RepID=UPI0037933E40